MAARHRIYLSYRRTDAGYARRLSDELAERLGRDHVFVGVDPIEPSVDWAQKLAELVESASVVIAVIGPGWADDDGRRRLNEPGDFVRHELATAMMSDTPVVPILVGGGTLPPANELPPDLAALEALKVHEVHRLVTTLERIAAGP